jgi:hypothetical protein
MQTDDQAWRGALLAVHRRRKTRTYPLLGDEVHELPMGHTQLENNKTIIEAHYRLDHYEDAA